MINEDPNMGRKQIFNEMPLPSKVEEKGILNLIYKGVFIIVKLLLDIRLNLVKISEGKTIQTKYKQTPNSFQKSATTEKKVDNAVIKDTDKVTVFEAKSDVQAEVKPEPDKKPDDGHNDGNNSQDDNEVQPAKEDGKKDEELEKK